MSEVKDPECLLFRPLYMERVWGGQKLATLFGRQLPTANPIGESWELVDRSEAQSVVSAGKFTGTTLHDLWTKHRNEVFGDGYDYERFNALISPILSQAWEKFSMRGWSHTTVLPLIDGFSISLDRQMQSQNSRSSR
jgi:hypothetical protein